MSQISIDINADKVLEMFKHFSPAQAEAAWHRTLRKTGNYVKTLVGREVSKEKQIPLKVLRDRLNFYLKSPSTAKVWLGLNPIEAHRLAYGAGARQRGNGVTAGGVEKGAVVVFDGLGYEVVAIEPDGTGLTVLILRPTT